MNNKRKLLIVLLVVAVSTLGVGFAAFSTKLNIIPNAFVNPNENDFSVVLTTRRNTLKTTDIIVEKSDNSIVTEDVVINNSRYPTISNIAANLSSPGQSVAFKFYVYNNGEYDAYLTNINYKKLSNDGTKLCSPLTGTSAEQANSACEAINFSMTIDGDEYNETTGLSNHKLVKGTSEEIILTVEYDENGPTTPGGFSADFSDIELIFGSVDSSYSIDPSTGEIITKQYTLTYDADGGTIENNETTKVITYNTKIGELTSPSRTGYTFSGWYTDKTYTTLVTEDTIYSLKGDMTIYAKWTPNVYSIVFNPLPGALGENDITGKDVTYDSTYGEMPTPTRDGYIFEGWYLEDTYHTKIESNTKVEITSRNTPLYAKYVENNFTITLDPNGGTLNNTTKNITYGEMYGNLEEPTRTGYTFDGWYTENNTKINSTDTYQLLTNQTLHAEWIANEYTITLNPNGGTISSNTKTVTYDSTYGNLEEPARTGYTFSGWYTDNTYETQITSDTIVKITSNNETLIAKWEANQYHINYYSDNQLVRTDDINYEASYNNFPTVSKEGYTLTGWFTAETGGTQVQTSDIFRETSDQNLYAHWQTNTNTQYKVKHWKQKVDGDASQHNSTNYTLEETDTLYGTTDTTATPDRKTYTGFTSPSGETITITGNGNAVLNYYYTRNTYTVSFDININDDDEYTLSKTDMSVLYGSTYGEIATATRTGYTFSGWYTDTNYDTQITSSTPVTITTDQVLYAKWTANVNTNYTVYHYTQNIDGNASVHDTTNYTLRQTENLQGETGHNVTPAVKTYTGFTAPSTQTKKIKSDGSMVIKYYYTRNQYTLTVTKGTGINTVTGAGTYYFEQSVTIGYTVKTGYTFSSITGDVSTTTFTMPASNTEATVNATANTYNITYNLDGGSITGTNPTTGTYNSNITLKSPTKTGYTFTGWTVTSGLNTSTAKYGTSSDDITTSIASTSTLVIGSNTTANTYVKNLTDINNGDVTLTANYTANVYNLSLYLYDNQYYENSTYTITYNSNYPELPTPTRDGYIFGGWYKSNSFLAQDEVTSSTIVTETEDTTLYAKWTVNTYTIIYNANGGTGSMDNQTATYDTEITLSENQFTRTGFTFDGWTTNSDGTGTHYDDEDDVTNLTSESSVTLYAKWIANQYTVTLNKNADEAALTTTSINVTYGDTYSGLNSVQTTPTRTGYSFIGWYTDASGGTLISSSSTVQTAENHTLYAHWQPLTYQVTFDANGGVVDVNSKYVEYDNTYGEYNSSTQIYDDPLPTPTRVGYTFIGWYTAASGGTQKSNDTVVNIISAETLYAHWQANTDTAYTVNHWQQKVGGNANFHNSSNYTLIETDNLTGTTDTTVTPDRKTYTGFTSPSGQEITILGNGSVTVDYYYARESYSVTFNSKGGSAVNTVLNVTYGYSYGTMPSSPTKTGYTFGGWYLDDESYETQITNNSTVTTASNHVLYAKWTPRSNTAYTVYHWKQNLDGDASLHDDTNYTLAATENLNGTTDASVTPTRNEYDGFTAPAGQTVTIAADGTTVVNYYYTRNSYTLTVNSGTGISATTGAGTYLYGESVTIGYTVSTGYTFLSVTGDKTTTTFTMPASNTTVTVNAEANTYTIYFDGNGNTSGSVSNEQMTYDEAKTLNKNNYTKTGYTFDGWSTNSDGSGNQYTDEQSVINLATSGIITLYAKWAPNKYNITFDKNHEDATGTMENQEATYNTNVTLTSNAYTRPGYTFDGWSTTSNGSKVYDDGATFKWTRTTDQTLYARWKASNIVVTYDANGGTVSSSTKNVTYGSTYGTLQTPSRTGYTFSGWYLETDTTFQNEITSSTTVSIASNHTLVAKWTPITYTYKLRIQDATTSWSDLPDNTAAYDDIVTLTSPTKTGYTFTGWTITMNYNLSTTRWGTSSSDVNETYSSGLKMVGELPTDPVYVKNLRNTSSGYVGLQANWTGNKYTVTLNPNGGTLSKTETEVTYGSAYTGLSTPSKLGYAFDGWYLSTDINYENRITNNTTVSTASNHTLVAKWSPIVYNINYNLGTNGVANEVSPSTATYDQVFAVGAPTREGYTYSGWRISSGLNTNLAKYGSSSDSVNQPITSAGNTLYISTGDKTIYFKNLTTSTSGVTLTAMWTANQYTVTLNANGGSISSNSNWTGSGATATKQVTYGSSYGTIPTSTTVTRTGYTFGGWYTDTNYTTQVTTSTQVTTASNHTLYAKWTPNDDTNYTVRHWQQNVDGDASLHDTNNYTLVQTENLNGTTEASVTPEVNTYEGFTSPSTQTVTIAADGTTAVNYYYTRNSYTLTVNKGTGISAVTGAGSYLYGASVNVGYTVSTGYSFTSITGDKTTASFTMPASNVTVTVNGEANTYDITYNLDGGSVTGTNPTSGTYDSVLTLESPTKTGYTFTGWTVTSGLNTSTAKYGSSSSAVTSSIASDSTLAIGSSATANTYVKNLTAAANGSVTLTANWQPIVSNVTFDANGGNAVNEVHSITYGQRYGGSYINGLHTNPLPTATRTGYTFLGWYTEASDGDLIINSTIVSRITDQVLYAHWTANSYDISYNLDGGSIAGTNPTTGTYDSVLTLESPTKTGYTFTGWTVTSGLNTSTAKYGSSSSTVTSSIASTSTLVIGSNATANTYVKNLTAESGGSVTLTANYTANTYTVSFDANGGNAVNSTITVTYGSTYGTLPEATRTGYTFDGWYTEASGGTEITSESTVTIIADQTLYAHWTANTYAINYSLDSGTVASNNPTTATYDEVVTLKSPTKEGYTFTGWTVTSGLNTSTAKYGTTSNVVTTSIVSTSTLVIGSSAVADTYVKNLTSTNNETVILTANYTANTYNITYNLDGGTLKTNNPATGTYDELITLKSPIKPGYIFTGWTVTSGLNTSTAKYGTTSNAVTTSIASTSTLVIGSSAVADTYVKNLTQANNGNVTLKANWSPESITVTLDADGGTIISSANWNGSGSTVTKTVLFDSEYGILPTSSEISNNGYTLLGWYTEPTGGTQVTPSTVLNAFKQEYTIYAHWTDTTDPKITLSKETYKELNLGNNWTTNVGGTYDSSTGIFSMTPNSNGRINIYTSYIPVNGDFWYFTYDAYVTSPSEHYSSSGYGGMYMTSYYYDENKEATTTIGGSSVSGYTSKLIVEGSENAWQNNKDVLFEGSVEKFRRGNRYGPNVKYVRLRFYYVKDSSNEKYWSEFPVQIKNLRVYGESIPNDFYIIKYSAEDNDGIQTVKWASGSRNESYFASNGTALTDHSGEIRVTSNGTYTVYAEDDNGNKTVQTIEITGIE